MPVHAKENVHSLRVRDSVCVVACVPILCPRTTLHTRGSVYGQHQCIIQLADAVQTCTLMCAHRLSMTCGACSRDSSDDDLAKPSAAASVQRPYQSLTGLR